MDGWGKLEVTHTVLLRQPELCNFPSHSQLMLLHSTTSSMSVGTRVVSMVVSEKSTFKTKYQIITRPDDKTGVPIP
jgi:hypothetical protein